MVMTWQRKLGRLPDIDDTLVRTFGSKRIPITAMVRHVREWKDAGVVLHAWSTGGGDYASTAKSDLFLFGKMQNPLINRQLQNLFGEHS